MKEINAVQPERTPSDEQPVPTAAKGEIRVLEGHLRSGHPDLALAEAANDGRIRPGHLVLMEAMGGGFTWGSALVRW